MSRRKRHKAPGQRQNPTDAPDNNPSDEQDSGQPDWDNLPPSKTRLKKDAHLLQRQGQRLTELNDAQLAELPLPPRLHEAILESRRLRAREAKRRHLQFIGKLMREVDADELQLALDRFDAGSVVAQKLQHHVEQWRDRLLAEDSDTALSDFLDQHPDADRQQLRHVLLQARQEHSRNANLSEGTQAGKTQGRKLFRLLREHLDQPVQQDAPTQQAELDAPDETDTAT